MDDLITRFWSEISARPNGPLAFRVYLQPIMASIFAIRDGWHDAEEGKPAYFWALFTNPAARADLVSDGWKGIRRVFFFGIVMDLVYQAIQLRGFRPIETVFVATTLAIVPYVLMRGPINRIIRAWQRRDRTRRRAA
jgi:hypothetical protein